MAQRGMKNLNCQLPSGFLAVYKPKNWTSFGVVSKIRGILSGNFSKLTGIQVKLKVGHGGTLDPSAEGVLVLGIGNATTQLGQLLAGTKTYIAVGKLGEERDTLDGTGKIIGEKSYTHVTMDLIEEKFAKFSGNIMQTPPMYSAIQVNGKRLYHLARSGQTIEREPRPVTIYSSQLYRPKIDENSFLSNELIEKNISFLPSPMKQSDFSILTTYLSSSASSLHLPYFLVEIQSSGGFYVRSMISDLAVECSSVGHMHELCRTKQGPFTLEDCLLASDWEFEKILEKIKICTLKGTNEKN